MRPVNSMIEFKQIIGRGTRLFDGKDYFTIYDFVKAYEHFNDPEWDGEPQAPEPRRSASCRGLTEDDRRRPEGGGAGEERPPARIKIKLADGKERDHPAHDGDDVLERGRQAHVGGAIRRTPVWRAARISSRMKTSCAASGAGRTRARRCWKACPRKATARPARRDQSAIDAEKSDIFDVLAYIAFALRPSRGGSGRTRASGRSRRVTTKSFRPSSISCWRNM